MDILPSLLLPLAGPEEFSEEETERLPIDLQYLPNDKTREEDPDIRKMLLEALKKAMLSVLLLYPIVVLIQDISYLVLPTIEPFSMEVTCRVARLFRTEYCYLDGRVGLGISIAAVKPPVNSE